MLEKASIPQIDEFKMKNVLAIQSHVFMDLPVINQPRFQCSY